MCGNLREPMNYIVFHACYRKTTQPVLSNAPAQTSIVLFKELTGYPNYGNPSGNADILYTGNRGTWTFDIQPFYSYRATLLHSW